MFFFQILSFETKRDFCLINLRVPDENEIFSFKISCFEKDTRITFIITIIMPFVLKSSKQDFVYGHTESIVN